MIIMNVPVCPHWLSSLMCSAFRPQPLTAAVFHPRSDISLRAGLSPSLFLQVKQILARETVALNWLRGNPR
jgi:hypothetical protein